MKAKPTVLDLFSGAGGLSLGFELAGFQTLGGVDIYKQAVETYQYNFPDAVGIEADIRELTTDELLREVDAGDINVVIGGPPCQGFSTVGRVKIASLAKNGQGMGQNISVTHPRFIDDPRNVLYREFVRIVRDVQPDVIVMENVPGMMSYRNGEIVREIIEDFRAAGMKHVMAKVLTAADYGVPQIRKRIIFIGTKHDIPVIFPEPTHADIPSPQVTVDGNTIYPYVTVWEAISDLPEIEAGDGAEVMDYDKPPESEYQKWARKGSDKVYNHRARRHSERDLYVFSIMKPGMVWKDLPEEIRKKIGYRDDVFRDKFRRLPLDRPSWTVTAHLYKDGYAFIHPTQNRTITPREAARLQSFPDWFVFRGSMTHQFKQIGNAVPPLMAKAIAEAVMKMLQMAGVI